MKTIILLLLFYLLTPKLFGQDSLFNKVDTILCVEPTNQIHFNTPYDTMQYSAEWINIESGNILTTSDSVNIQNLDSLILISTPVDSLQKVLIDTIFINLRRFPIIDFSIPRSECFTGDTLFIKDNSIYDLAYTEVIYSDINGTSLIARDSLIGTFVENGTNNSIIATYEITECGYTIDTTLSLSTKLQPKASFDFQKTCENEFLKINNSSTSVFSMSNYEFTVENKTYSFLQDNEFTLSDTLANGSYMIIGIVDNNNECIDSFSTQINIDEVTYVNFTGLESTYCAFQDRSEIIANIIGGTFEGQFVNDLNNGLATFIPTSEASNILVSYTYTNNAQCTDVYSDVVNTVHPKPDLQLNNLLPEYCEKDPATEISINQSNGTAEFQLLLNNLAFEELDGFFYTFDPVFPGEYQITNYYEDNNGCQDTLISGTTVHPLPVVGLDSLEIIKPGESIIIGNTAATGPNVDFLWSTGSNASSIEVNQPGIYIIEGINLMTGCSAKDTIKVEYDSLIESELLEIQIAPNPTSDVFTLKVNPQIIDIRIVNVFGEEIPINGNTILNTNQSGELVIDLSNNANGYYYLIIPNIGNFLIIKI